MSSLKKHFPHFGSHNQHNSGSQAGKQGADSCSKSVTTCHRDGRSLPATGIACSSDPTLSEQMDAASFKADVLSCLDLCSSYIQALNNLCSAGAVLAQNLTQVFSRDVVCGSAGLLSPPPVAKTESRRRLLGLRAGLVRQCQATPHPAAESDSLYYDMTEQFLRVWEMMSVSTAGASATIKTETLMTLQEVINQLESADPYGDGSGGPDLGQRIDSAKSCLLAYIELQAQFSHNSYKSLNHLSKALKSDTSMTDVVKNIKQHFDFSPKSAVADACSSRSEDQSQDPVSQDPKIKTSSAAQNVSGLKEAMDLLSLDGRSRRCKRRRRAKPLSKKERRDASGKSCEKENILNSAKPSATRLSHLGDKCFSSSQMGSVDAAFDAGIRSQPTSTWPGKVGAGVAVASERKEKNPESWSLWSSQSPAFADSGPAGSPWRDNAQYAYWNVFPAQSSQSLSASNLRAATAALSASTMSGSGASSNNSIGVPSSTSSSVATNRSYDLFAPMQNNPVNYFNGTHSLKSHVSGIITNNNINNNNNNDLGFGGFGSLNNILHRDRTTSPTTAAAKRLGSGDVTFNSPVLPNLCSAGRSPLLLSPDHDHQPVCSAAALLPDSVRFKTSTWPLKQESGPPLLSNSPSSTLSNSNWLAVAAVPFHYSSETDRHFDNEPLHRPDVTQSLWSFDGPQKVSALPKQLHQRQLHNLQQPHVLPIDKADITRFTLFETNNNGGLSDKNF